MVTAEYGQCGRRSDYAYIGIQERIMNEYRYKFYVRCPNNNDSVQYQLIISHNEIIMVELIISSCILPPSYHETIADILRKKLPGRQTITATHSGVVIITKR